MSLFSTRFVVVIGATLLATAAHATWSKPSSVTPATGAGRVSQPSAAALRQAPQPSVVIPDFAAPPPTLDKFVDAVPLIVRVEVENSHLRSIGPPGRAVVMTDHVSRVLEIFKGDELIRQRNTIVFSQYGGTLEVGGQEVTTDYGGVRRPSIGEEVVVFLEKGRRGTDQLNVAYGRAGLFRLETW